MLQCARQGEYNLPETEDRLEIPEVERGPPIESCRDIAKHNIAKKTPPNATAPKLIAGRLALDFANLVPVAHDLSWREFVDFLVDSRVVSEERGTRLESLEGSEPGAVDAVLLKILRLRECVWAVFSAVEERRDFPKAWVAPINESLRITAGHDELVAREGRWRLEVIGRENGLGWVLAESARSAAEVTM